MQLQHWIHTHTHTHTRLMAHCLGLPGWAGTRKVKPIWILLKKETVSGSGISWAVCKSAPCSRQTTTRQTTTPAPHYSVFYRPYALPAAQPTAPKHWRHFKREYNTEICIEKTVGKLQVTNPTTWLFIICWLLCHLPVMVQLNHETDRRQNSSNDSDHKPENNARQHVTNLRTLNQTKLRLQSVVVQSRVTAVPAFPVTFLPRPEQLLLQTQQQENVPGNIQAEHY